MKINDKLSLSTGGIASPATGTAARSETRTAAEGTQASAKPAVDIQLSSRSRELHAALEAARQSPDVRADKVAEVKDRVAAGQYRVDLNRVAQRMIDREA